MTATEHSFHSAVLAQPGHLRGGGREVSDALDAIDLAPLRAGTLVVSGIGASWHATAPFVHALRRAGRRAFGVPAPALADAGPARLGDAYVLVSQSGRSVETVAGLERLGDAPVLAVSSDASGPLAERATAWLPLGPEHDTELSTLGYTGTLQTLGMLAEAIATGSPGDHWAALPDRVEEVLAGAEAGAAHLAERFAAIRCLDAIGPGASLSSAGETALLAREGLRLPATGEETRQYLHGPLEAVAPGFGCVVFGGAREHALAGELVRIGAEVATISAHPSSPVPGAAAFTLPAVHELAAPILEILPVQLAVQHLATAKGLALAGLRRSQDDTKLGR